MKLLGLFYLAGGLLLFLTVVSCNEKTAKNTGKNATNDSDGMASFEFNEELHNFGTLVAGENVSFSFVLKNTGATNLLIKGVESDCGCISVKFDSTPVGPGKTTIVEIGFNSSGLFGRQYKPVAVEMNSVEKIKYIAVVADVKNELLEINN
jgi:hypothetical protein